MILLSGDKEGGRTLLHIACIEGDVSLVRTLEYKADVMARDDQNNTPLGIMW